MKVNAIFKQLIATADKLANRIQILPVDAEVSPEEFYLILLIILEYAAKLNVTVAQLSRNNSYLNTSLAEILAAHEDRQLLISSYAGLARCLYLLIVVKSSPALVFQQLEKYRTSTSIPDINEFKRLQEFLGIGNNDIFACFERLAVDKSAVAQLINRIVATLNDERQSETRSNLTMLLLLDKSLTIIEKSKLENYFQNNWIIDFQLSSTIDLMSLFNLQINSSSYYTEENLHEIMQI